MNKVKVKEINLILEQEFEINKGRRCFPMSSLVYFIDFVWYKSKPEKFKS